MACLRGCWACLLEYSLGPPCRVYWACQSCLQEGESINYGPALPGGPACRVCLMAFNEASLCTVGPPDGLNRGPECFKCASNLPHLVVLPSPAMPSPPPPCSLPTQARVLSGSSTAQLPAPAAATMWLPWAGTHRARLHAAVQRRSWAGRIRTDAGMDRLLWFRV